MRDSMEYLAALNLKEVIIRGGENETFNWRRVLAIIHIMTTKCHTKLYIWQERSAKLNCSTRQINENWYSSFW